MRSRPRSLSSRSLRDRRIIALAFLTLHQLTYSVIAAEPPTPAAVASPVDPEDSLRLFQHDPAVTIELVAAEPEVLDPIAVQFGTDGGLWVVELRDYPYGPPAGEPPRSRIKQLHDRDGDGRYETARVFADELLFVTGMLPYRDGLIATIAGQILFLADRDGDGRAEVRETWFSGFAEENSQLRANHPTYGPDGYVYVANGLRGGKIVAERPAWKSDRAPLVITGFDFRFHPETGDFSTVNGHGQFGLTFDEFGREFVCSNRNPCQHVVLDDRYLKQNTLHGVRQVMHDVALPAEQSRLYPISRAWTTSTLHANQFTAACGVLSFRGPGLSPAFQGDVFTCDPTGNLVHREVLEPAGATFRGRSPYEQREFLASPDTWFRPVNLSNGPDGALYVVDMYRAVIEHPDWMPTELRTRKDLMDGHDRGRIYRVRRADGPRITPKSWQTDTAGDLVKALESDIPHDRETAVRLLAERHALDQVPAITKMVSQGQHAATRVHALRLLSRWARLTPEVVGTAFGDPAPEVRETALLVGERWMHEPSWRSRVLARTQDESARVRFQAVLSLALTPVDAELAERLVAVARRDADDPWLRDAVITTARELAAPLLGRLLADAEDQPISPGVLALARELSALAAAPHSDPLRSSAVWSIWTTNDPLHTQVALRPLAWSVFDGLATGLSRRGIAWDAELREAMLDPKVVERMLQQAATIAADRQTDSGTRLAALPLLKWLPADQAGHVLLPLALEEPSLEIQAAAFEGLAGFAEPSWADPLLVAFPSASPSVRRGILDVLLAGEGRATALVGALEQGSIKPTELDPVRAQRLINHPVAALRDRAKKVLETATAERGAVLAAYQQVLELQADPQRGRLVFEKQCVTCHRIGDRGVNVGPDIGDTRDKTPAVLLTSILDPNRAVDNNSFGYVVITTAGKSLTGLIVAESSAAITLRQAEGKTETILRSDIEELRNTGLSLMPVGFEKTIPPADMADLLSFLKNWRYLDGAVPLAMP